MKQFEKTYEENKKLDEIFDSLYDVNDKNIIEKNILELLVELGELANETRCFKYWSDKKPSEKEVILDEYADCLIMVFYMCSRTKISLDEEFSIVNETNIVEQFKKLYSLVSSLNYNLDKETIKEILSNTINLGRLLNFSYEDITTGHIAKINRNKKRFETGF